MVEPLLAESGFEFDDHMDNIHEGGPKWPVVIDRANHCKIQFYQSPRGGG